jgi:hypothetical protein
MVHEGLKDSTDYHAAFADDSLQDIFQDGAQNRFSELQLPATVVLLILPAELRICGRSADIPSSGSPRRETPSCAQETDRQTGPRYR